MTLSNTNIKPTLTPELAASAGSFFNLGSIDSYREFESAINLNVHIKCARGDFLLRVYHQGMTNERITFLQTVKSGLRKYGILAPEPIGWAHSNELGLDFGRIIELEHFIPHQPVSYSWDHHERVFPTLGKLHDCLKIIVDDHNFVPTEIHNYALPSQLSTWLNMTESKIRASDSRDIQDALKVCSRTRDFLRTIDEWWIVQGNNLPKQAVHGDFNTGTNVTTSSDQTTIVFDFDFVDIHERVFDIAYSMFFAIGSIEWGKPLEEIDWSRITRSIELYSGTSECPLTQQEWEALPIELARVQLYWICSAGFAPDPATTILEEGEGLEDSFWILEHLQSLLLHPNSK